MTAHHDFKKIGPLHRERTGLSALLDDLRVKSEPGKGDFYDQCDQGKVESSRQIVLLKLLNWVDLLLIK